MSLFYICRHGQTENNLAGRLQGWIDTPLTIDGKLNVETSAKKLSGKTIDKIVSSDLGRAFATAYIISNKLGHTDEIQTLSGFREINYGDYANITYENIPLIDLEEYSNFVYPNGESLEQMKLRVFEALKQLSSDNPDLVILIVAHDGTINAIKSAFEDIDMATADQTHNANDFVAKFTYEDGKIASFSELS